MCVSNTYVYIYIFSQAKIMGWKPGCSIICPPKKLNFLWRMLACKMEQMLLQNLNTSYHIWVNLIFFFTKKCQQNRQFIEIQWKSPNILLLFSLPFKLIIIDEITKQKFFCGKVGLEVYKGRFNVCLFRDI